MDVVVRASDRNFFWGYRENLPGPLLRRSSLKKVLDLIKVFDLVLHYMITACWERILLENERLWMPCIVFLSPILLGPGTL